MMQRLLIKKDYLFILMAIVLLIICYQLAFKRTFAAWQLHKRLTGQSAQSGNLSVQPAYLYRKDQNLSKIIGQYKTDTSLFRSNIISTISLLAEKENVKLSDVPVQDPLYNTSRFTIQKLSFDGDFFSLTKVLNRLYLTHDVGIVRSVTYRTVKLRSKAEDVKKIIMDVYLENVK